MSLPRNGGTPRVRGRGRSNRDNSTAWTDIFRRKRGRGIISLREEQRAFWERASKKQ